MSRAGARTVGVIGSSISLVLFVFACVGDDPVSGGDAVLDGGGDTAVPDADTDAAPGDASPPCDLSKPFNAPLLVQGVNTAAAEQTPGLSADERTIYFARATPGDFGTFEIFEATRPTRDAAFEQPTKVSINGPGFDSDPFLLPDGTGMVFASIRDGGVGASDMYFATRDPVTRAFGPASAVTGANSSHNDGNASLTANGTQILFVQGDMIDQQLYRAAFNRGAVSGILPLIEIDSPFNESFPIASADGKTLLFASTRPDAVPPSSEANIWSATRDEPSVTFGALEPLTVLNSAEDDLPSWLSPDGCRLYLWSRRPGVGDSDIYRAERSK